jgi:protein CpxP
LSNVDFDSPVLLADGKRINLLLPLDRSKCHCQPHKPPLRDRVTIVPALASGLLNINQVDRINAIRSTDQNRKARTYHPMKITKFSLVALIALGGLLAFSPVAQAQEKKADAQQEKGKGKGPDQLAQMTELLKLTADQQAKLKPIIEARAKKMAAIREATTDQAERRAKTQELQPAFTADVKKILTPEQFDTWEKDQASKKGKGQGKKKKQQ